MGLGGGGRSGIFALGLGLRPRFSSPRNLNPLVCNSLPLPFGILLILIIPYKFPPRPAGLPLPPERPLGHASIDDELEQVLVRIPDVPARTATRPSSSPARSLDRSFDNYRICVAQHALEISFAPVPDETEIAARRLRA